MSVIVLVALTFLFFTVLQLLIIHFQFRSKQKKSKFEVYYTVTTYDVFDGPSSHYEISVTVEAPGAEAAISEVKRALDQKIKKEIEMHGFAQNLYSAFRAEKIEDSK